jgi:hypothetical protein
MVVHYLDKKIVVLIPKMNFGLIRFKPPNVNDHKNYKEIGNEHLEVSEIF